MCDPADLRAKLAEFDFPADAEWLTKLGALEDRGLVSSIAVAKPSRWRALIKTVEAGLKLDNDETKSLRAAVREAAKELKDAAECTDSGAVNEEPSLADLIVALVQQRADLWHDAVPDAYATVAVQPKCQSAQPPVRHETYRVGGAAFRRYVRGLAYHETNAAPNEEALRSAINTIDAIAIHDGERRAVSVRIAEDESADLWLDLGRADWSRVRITRNGWNLSGSSLGDKVRFWRPRGVLSLAVPVRGGRLDEFRKLWPQLSDGQWALIAGWLVGTLRPGRPAPVLLFTGEHGSGKSTLARMVRGIVDPNIANLRAPPRNERDLVIAARNAGIVAYDNVSSIADWLSDAIARLATGGGYGTRALYTDGEEMLTDVIRPVMLNGIGSIATRADLLDRAVIIHVPKLDEGDRRDDDELRGEYNEMRPRVLGALLDAGVTALEQHRSVTLSRGPRMITWARWAVAAEPAYGVEPGTFLDAYCESRATAVEEAIEGEAIGPVLVGLLEQTGAFEGTCEDLLGALAKAAGERATRQKQWPKTARGVRGQLDRLAPPLRTIGYEVTYQPRTRAGRRVAIRPTSIPVLPEPSARPDHERDGRDDLGDGLRGVDRPKSDEFGLGDGCDGRDGCLRAAEADAEHTLPTGAAHGHLVHEEEGARPPAGEVCKQPSRPSQPSHRPNGLVDGRFDDDGLRDDRSGRTTKVGLDEPAPSRTSPPVCPEDDREEGTL